MNPRRFLWPLLFVLVTAACSDSGGGDGGGGGGGTVGTVDTTVTTTGETVPTASKRLTDIIAEVKAKSKADELAAGAEAEVGENGPANITLQGTQPSTMEDFVTGVIKDVNVYWKGVFAATGVAYDSPYFDVLEAAETTTHNCGSSLAGDPNEADGYNPAFYCAGAANGSPVTTFDTIYFSAPWLLSNFESLGGNNDFAIAYVVAHEMGHHVQHEAAILDEDGGICCGLITPQIELQADCLAGIWANSAYYEGQLEDTDVEEGVGAATLAGDYEFYDEDHHGTPSQRVSAFLTGYNSGQAVNCTTTVEAYGS